MVVSKPAIKYLRVIIDVKLSFNKHLEYSYQKTAAVTTALTRMLPNVSEVKHIKFFLAGVVLPMLF